MKKIALIIIILLSIILPVQAIDDSTAFINSGNAGTTLESYHMKNLPQNLSDSQIYIKTYNVNVHDLNEIETIVKFTVSSDGMYPIIIGLDKNAISLESFYLNGDPIDIDRLQYSNFFFCDPEFEICEDIEINNDDVITFQGPKGMNMRGYPISFTLYSNQLYELKFTLKNIEGNVGAEYPFENYFYNYSLYIPSHKTTINNLVINLNNYIGNAVFIQEKSDYKKSKLVDSKFTNIHYSSTQLKTSENSLKLDILPSEELIYNDYILFIMNLSLKNSYQHIIVIMFMILFTLFIASYIGFQYGSKQEGKLVLFTIITTLIYSIIFSLFVPLKFLFSTYIIILILVAYFFMYIFLKLGSAIKDFWKK